MLTQKSLEGWAQQNSLRFCMAAVGSRIPLPDGLPGAVLKDVECDDPAFAATQLKLAALIAYVAVNKDETPKKFFDCLNETRARLLSYGAKE